MGQFISSTNDRSHWMVERCRCRDRNTSEESYMLATYRCQYETCGDSSNKVPGQPLFDSYWRGSSFNREKKLIQFVACELCITDETRHYFTHHPEGWKSHIKYAIDYEPIKGL